jgi:hypothetical protein
MDLLSQEERRELEEYPMGTIREPLPPDRLALRRSIAEKQFEVIRSTEWFQERPDPVRAAYEQRPPWKFYTGADGYAVRRVYGVLERADGSCALHAVTAHYLFVNDVVGGIECADVYEVAGWTEAQHIVISMCPCPSVFLDPCGWVEVAVGRSGESQERCSGDCTGNEDEA